MHITPQLLQSYFESSNSFLQKVYHFKYVSTIFGVKMDQLRRQFKVTFSKNFQRKNDLIYRSQWRHELEMSLWPWNDEVTHVRKITPISLWKLE